jgi:predicted ArsR family transcriptional regulator
LAKSLITLSIAAMDLPIHQSDEPIRPVDQLVLDLLRREQGLSIQELMDRLEVTATAIRQRVERLEAAGLIEKKKRAVGRGRPQYNYFLTDMGWRQAGVTYSELAISLWNAIGEIDDQSLKSQIVERVAQKMGDCYKAELPDASIGERMRSLAGVLSTRKVPASYLYDKDLPVLEVHACPYPGLVDSDGDRSVCQLEQEALSQALGHEVQLSKCRLDGHGCCQFSPVANSELSGEPQQLTLHQTRQ